MLATYEKRVVWLHTSNATPKMVSMALADQSCSEGGMLAMPRSERKGRRKEARETKTRQMPHDESQRNARARRAEPTREQHRELNLMTVCVLLSRGSQLRLHHQVPPAPQRRRFPGASRHGVQAGLNPGRPA